MASNEETKQPNEQDPINTNESRLPKYGLPIACDKLGLMLCKPKLLPLQSYSFMRMQMQARHQIDKKNDTTTTRTSNARIK